MLEGAGTLFRKELLRFWKVAFQTVAAPVLTAVLYLLIFGHVLSNRVQVFEGVGYTSFLIPGLVMMSVLQNAFANSSSSLIQSKITGNLVFLLVTPLSHWAWYLAYVGASVVRGVAVGGGVLLVTLWFAPLHAAGCQPEDLEIGRADLENVFLEFMQGESKPLPLKAAVEAAA